MCMVMHEGDASSRLGLKGVSKLEAENNLSYGNQDGHSRATTHVSHIKSWPIICSSFRSGVSSILCLMRIVVAVRVVSSPKFVPHGGAILLARATTNKAT